MISFCGPLEFRAVLGRC